MTNGDGICRHRFVLFASLTRRSGKAALAIVRCEAALANCPAHGDDGDAPVRNRIAQVLHNLIAFACVLLLERPRVFGGKERWRQRYIGACQRCARNAEVLSQRRKITLF